MLEILILLVAGNVRSQLGNFARGPPNQYGFRIPQNIGQATTFSFDFPQIGQFPVNNIRGFQNNNPGFQNNNNGFGQTIIRTKGSQGTASNQESYNCAGLAFRNFKFVGLEDTQAALSQMRQVECRSRCKSNEYKFAFWPYDAAVQDKNTGQTGPSHKDFHIVGERTNNEGDGPFKVYSKNGHRPIEEPRSSLLAWYPVSGEVRENDGTPDIVRNKISKRTNVRQFCYCHGSLPI
jgi:hypothetical protein